MLGIGGAVAGGAWTTGLAVIAQGWRPRVSVLGDEGWQVLLFEHGGSRAIVLCGVLDNGLSMAIDHLCGVLRQHIDVVAGTSDALALLSPDFGTRRSVSTFVRLDPASEMTHSPSYIGLTEPIVIRLGMVTIDLTPLWSSAWNQGLHLPESWIGQAAFNDLRIGFGPSLDTLADHGDPHAAVAIAPGGDAGRLWRTLPGVTIATNARETLPSLSASLPDGAPAALVRTFPRDIALFEFKGRRLTLPAWEERDDGLGRS